MGRLLICVTALFALLLLVPPCVQSREPTDFVPRHESIGRQSLELVGWDWRTVIGPVPITFLPGRPGLLGMYYADRDAIDVWVRDEHTPDDVSGTVVHELAHAYDDIKMTDGDRKEWYAVRRIPARKPWSKGCAKNDTRCGAGDFAECVRWTLRGPGTFKSRLGGPPDKRAQALIRRWLKAPAREADD